MKANNREKIIRQPSYWIEHINVLLYNAICDFMEENDLKQKDLANILEVSPGRVSQILNDGEINFSIDKMVKILLKMGKVPLINIEDIGTFLENEIEVERELKLNQKITSL